MLYSPRQRLEGSKSSVFADGCSCVAAVAHRNFNNEVSIFSRSFSRVFPVLFPAFSNLKFKASVEESTCTLLEFQTTRAES